MMSTTTQMIDPRQIPGGIVRELRSRRGRGDAATELVRYLLELNVPRIHVTMFLGEAFDLSGVDTVVNRWSPDCSGSISDEQLNRYLTPHIDENSETWLNEPYPELMRRRDRLTFLNFACETETILFVCGANPFAGRFIGKAGYRLVPPELPVVSRLAPPNEGLVAADPQDRWLEKLLAANAPALAYDSYVKMLQECGLSVGSPEDGYVVRDRNGHALYEPYRLHGVYEKVSGANAWTGAAGEGLRAELNRRLGAELVTCGPHDVWEFRNDRKRAGARYGPQPPVILFDPRGDAGNFTDVVGLRRRYLAFEIDWNAIYPGHTGGSP